MRRRVRARRSAQLLAERVVVVVAVDARRVGHLDLARASWLVSGHKLELGSLLCPAPGARPAAPGRCRRCARRFPAAQSSRLAGQLAAVCADLDHRLGPDGVEAAEEELAQVRERIAPTAGVGPGALRSRLLPAAHVAGSVVRRSSPGPKRHGTLATVLGPWSRERQTEVALKDPERYFTEIDRLTGENLKERDPHNERRLLKLRHRAGISLQHHAGAVPHFPEPDFDAAPGGRPPRGHRWTNSRRRSSGAAIPAQRGAAGPRADESLRGRGPS